MPLNHTIFEQLNDAQWLWYHYNFLKDENEDFEKRRNMTEYLASFIAPEAVRQIVSAREKAVEVSDDNLRNVLKQLGGRDINLDAVKKSDGKVHSADPTQSMQRYRAEQQKKEASSSYKDWVDFDLGF